MNGATADLVDLYGAGVRSCNLQLHNFGAVTRFFGCIRTIKTLEDNQLIRDTVALPGNGAVLVVDGGGSCRAALVGDVLARQALTNGWSGLVIWGAIRDRAALKSIGLGIKALGSNPWKSKKLGVGALDVTVTFGDVSFSPGEWLYSDEDGILVSADKLDSR